LEVEFEVDAAVEVAVEVEVEPPVPAALELPAEPVVVLEPLDVLVPVCPVEAWPAPAGFQLGTAAAEATPPDSAATRLL
jgi:hypothetical protein